MRASLPFVLLLAAAIAVGAVVIAPVWAQPGGLAPSTRFTDGHLLGIALWGEGLARGELPSLHTPLVGWPNGADLRPLLWPSALLGALAGPAWAFNLTCALVPAFNVVGGWVLGAVLGRGTAGRALLGGLLAAHPWVIETLANGQVEQAVIGGAALQLAAAVWACGGDASGRPRWARVLAPAAVTALVGWAAPHVALAGAVLTGLWSLPELVRGPRRARWAAVLVATLVGALAVQAYHGPSFTPGLHVFAPKGSDGRPTSLADLPEVATLARLFLPPARAPNLPVVHPNWLGACLLVGTAWALVTRRAGRGVVIAGVFAVLALGPATTLGGATVPMPWAALGVVAPTIAKSMSAYRMLMGAIVALAVAASGAERRGRGAAAAIAVLLGLALVEGVVAATRPVPLPAQIVRTDASSAALRNGSGPVLDLPLAGPDCPKGPGHYLLEAARSGRPVPVLLTNARTGYAAVPGLLDGVARAWRSPDCAGTMRSFLDGQRFTAVVLHHHDEHCPVLPRQMGCLAEALGPGRTEEGVTWWEIPD